jgi:predicted phage terminase large subunit-like protein
MGVLVPAKTGGGRRCDFQTGLVAVLSPSTYGGTTWGVADNGYYLLHLWRGRVEFPELKRVLASLAEQWNPNAILVEDKASGQSLIQELKLSTALPVIPFKVDSDKQTRAQAVTPLMEAGRVFLPESAPWVSDFVEEMACFPNGIPRRRC